MKVLLNAGGEMVKVSEALLVEAAGSPCCGGSRMEIILNNTDGPPLITEPVVKAAAADTSVAFSFPFRPVFVASMAAPVILSHCLSFNFLTILSRLVMFNIGTVAPS